MRIDESCNDISLVDVYRRFGRTCGYHLQSRGVAYVRCCSSGWGRRGAAAISQDSVYLPVEY